MKHGKKILTILIVLALVAGAVGGIIYGVKRSQVRKVAVYRASELNYNWYYTLDGSSVEGYVTADAAQNVFIPDAASVREIPVRVGQEVVVGDILVVFDTEKARLNYEKAELSEQQVQLLLNVANRNLQTLNALRPVSRTGSENTEEIGILNGDEDYIEVYDDDYVYDDNGYEIIDNGETHDDEHQEEEPDTEPAVVYNKLNSDALAYNREDVVIITRKDLDPKEIEGMTDEEIDQYIERRYGPQLGTENKPYRFLCENGAVIDSTFVIHMKKQAEEREGSLYIQLEVRERNSVKGKLIEAWKMDASRFVDVPKEWTAKIIVDNYIKAPSPLPTPFLLATVTPTPFELETPTPTVPEPTVTGQVSPAGESDDSSGDNLPEDDSSRSIPPEDDSSGNLPVEDDSSGLDLSVIDGDETNVGASGEEDTFFGYGLQLPLTEQGLVGAPAVTSPGAGAADGRSASYGKKGSSGGGLSYAVMGMTEKYLLTAMATEFDPEPGTSTLSTGSQIAAALGIISSDVEMTAEEIKEAKKQEEQKIESLKLDQREAILKTKQAKEALEDGSVKAKMNGVVKAVTEPGAANASGSPVVQVAAAEGLFVKSAIPESVYGTVKAGDFAKIISWTSGQTFTGRVRDVSYYPDTSGLFGAGSGVTYYPVTIYISEKSQVLSDGEWVQVTVNGTGQQTFDSASDKLFLYKAFVRDDSGGKYVLIRDGDGRLAKRYIKVGELYGEAYEIQSGVTVDDWLAFPYGKNLSEGSATKQASIDELYAS